MVLRGSRQTALAVAGTGAGVGVFLAIIALLIGAPALILGVVVLLAISGLSAAFLTVPVSVGLEGDEVVYRTGRTEEHFPSGEVSACALYQSGTSGGWAFSNRTGARLFRLNAWRFPDTEVAAFCAAAGIRWDGPSIRPVDRLRRDTQTAAWSLGVGVLGAVVFMLFAVLSASSQSSAKDDLARYRAATSCNLFGAITSSCRLETQARVTSVDAGTYNATLHLTLVPGGGDYRTRLDLPSPNVGNVVAVELWSGRITKIAGRDTTDNPGDNPNLNINGVVAGFGLFALGSFGLAVYGWHSLSTARARLRAVSRG